MFFSQFHIDFLLEKKKKKNIPPLLIRPPPPNLLEDKHHITANLHSSGNEVKLCSGLMQDYCCSAASFVDKF